MAQLKHSASQPTDTTHPGADALDDEATLRFVNDRNDDNDDTAEFTGSV